MNCTTIVSVSTAYANPQIFYVLEKKERKKKDRDAKDIRTLTELDPLVRQNKNRSLTIVQMIVVWKKECCEYDPQNTIRTVGTV